MWTTGAILPNKNLIASLISFQNVKQRINPNLPLWNYKSWIMNIQLVMGRKKITITRVIAPIGEKIWSAGKCFAFSLSYKDSLDTTAAPFNRKNVPAVLRDIQYMCSVSFYWVWLRYLCNSACTTLLLVLWINSDSHKKMSLCLSKRRYLHLCGKWEVSASWENRSARCHYGDGGVTCLSGKVYPWMYLCSFGWD